MVARGPEQQAGVARRQVVLAHVQAGFEQHGEIGAVVDDQRARRLRGTTGATRPADSKTRRSQCPL